MKRIPALLLALVSCVAVQTREEALAQVQLYRADVADAALVMSPERQAMLERLDEALLAVQVALQAGDGPVTTETAVELIGQLLGELDPVEDADLRDTLVGIRILLRHMPAQPAAPTGTF